jgi:hypothetical protein
VLFSRRTLYLPLPSGERVGVRGYRVRSQNSDPPHPLASLTTSPQRGEVKIESRSRDADAPEACQRHCKSPPQKRREAERRKAHPSMAAPHDSMLPSSRARARQRSLRGSLASRRSAAALAKANASTFGSAPDPRFLRPGFNGRYPLSPVSSLPRTAGAGRSAGRSGTRSRPGAVCETARGDRTRCRKSDRIRNAPFTSELACM